MSENTLIEERITIPPKISNSTKEDSNVLTNNININNILESIINGNINSNVTEDMISKQSSTVPTTNNSNDEIMNLKQEIQALKTKLEHQTGIFQEILKKNDELSRKIYYISTLESKITEKSLAIVNLKINSLKNKHIESESKSNLVPSVEKLSIYLQDFWLNLHNKKGWIQAHEIFFLKEKLMMQFLLLFIHINIIILYN